VKTTKKAVVGLVAVAALLAIPATADAATSHPADTAGSTTATHPTPAGTADRAAAVQAERTGRSGVTLPSHTYYHADGSVETVADPAALAALKNRPASTRDACGSACDGKDPATFLAPMPGGPSHYTYCSLDAQTIYAWSLSSSIYVELRYSPTCRTAWSRGAGTWIAGFSYYLNWHERTRVYNPDGRYATYPPVWTAMLDDADLLYRACLDRQVGSPNHDWVCTSAY
jgi:hypothetical protein